MKIAVVGLGYWGPNLARNLAQCSSCHTVVLCDQRIEAIDALVPQYPQAEVALDFDQVLGDPTVDGVILATPVGTHYELALRALRAGKHVLVEKPLCTSGAEAAHLVAEAEGRRLVLMSGHTFLYSPSVQHVAGLLRTGELGRPIFAQASRVNLGIHRSDVSVIWDLGPHDLAILCYWFNEEPVRVSAIGRSRFSEDRPDVAFLNLEFPSGVIANLHLSWLSPTKVRRITLVNDLKMVVYEDTNSEEPLKLYDKGVAIPGPQDFGEYRVTYRTGDVISPRVETWEPLRREVEHFLERIEKGEGPGQDAARSVAIVSTLESASRSLAEGGRPVDIVPCAL